MLKRACEIGHVQIWKPEAHAEIKLSVNPLKDRQVFMQLGVQRSTRKRTRAQKRHI